MMKSILLGLLLLSLTMCTPREQAMNDTDTTMTSRQDSTQRKSITEVLEQHTPQWLQLPGVVGTGEGRDPAGNPAIIIMTNVDAAEVQSKVPSSIESYPVIIEEVGDVKPLKVE